MSLKIKVLVNSVLKNIMEATTTQNISVSHPGLLEVPGNKNVWELPQKHFIKLAKKKGKSAVMRGLLNLERWNNRKNPEISKKIRAIINSLKKNKKWENL